MTGLSGSARRHDDAGQRKGYHYFALAFPDSFELKSTERKSRNAIRKMEADKMIEIAKALHVKQEKERAVSSIRADNTGLKEGELIDLETVSTYCRMAPGPEPEPGTAEGGLERELSRQMGISREAIRVGSGTEYLLKSIISRAGAKRICIPMPDYFRYGELFSRRVLIRRNGDASVPALPDNIDALVLSNPNNPTGRYFDLKGTIEEARKKGVLAVVDEAYIDFAGTALSLARTAASSENLVVIRTMSKFYGMCSPKVAYAIGNSSLMQGLSVRRVPSAGEEMASALLRSPAKEIIRKDVMRRRSMLEGILSRRLKAEVMPSSTNFLMARLPTQSIYEVLAERNVKTLSLESMPGLKGLGYVRIGVGSYAQIAELERRLAR